jgi:hypothetical protein
MAARREGERGGEGRSAAEREEEVEEGGPHGNGEGTTGRERELGEGKRRERERRGYY